MSEEILKALTQLFAIITKQDDGVTEVERNFVEQFFKQRLSQDAVEEYLALYQSFLVDKVKKRRRPANPKKEVEGEEKKESREKLTSMKDSVRTLSICKKINKTLAQRQKVIVLIELLELVNCDGNFSEKRKEIINTVSEVFNIPQEEHQEIEEFVLKNFEGKLKDSSNILLLDSKESNSENHLEREGISGEVRFLKIPSIDLIFIQSKGNDELKINNHTIFDDKVYLYSDGSILTLAKGGSVYYSDIVAHFNKDSKSEPISFNCKHLEFRFPNGNIGLRDICISENRGNLIGIMGASGAGKTTLLNVLAGIESPTEGEVLINNINIHTQRDEVQGVIGYIPQDDILLEDLTVFENLYFNAKLCFKDSSEEEINERVDNTLKSLGLAHIKELKVGNVLNKKISGGQRKRLNIALELIREPAVLFVDEPTSGLSSRDSENVIDLLKELALKGKLIFVVIHQPSSDIYKKFDKMFLMDTGGYPVFYGNPINAVTHFKTASNQINSDQGACESCGNVNPEQIFDIIEGKIVNEYGQETDKRKVAPPEWEAVYRETHEVKFEADLTTPPPNSLKIPTVIKQWLIYTLRDLKSKVSNKQYLFINLLEAPLLAFVLSFIIRYRNSPDGTSYMFRYNENIPAYLLMSIVVALFMGLTVSAEEIIRDRKILKREQFLSLSKTSYLFSKIGLLFTLSAIQTVCFVLVGNLVLGIEGMFVPYWLTLFTISCFANVLGLNISASFDEVVNVYIVIPLLLIPQMILSGALFSFDKLHDTLRSEDKVPLMADVMASRWAYEGLAVYQFKNNVYNAQFYELDFHMSSINYKQAYLIPEIENMLNNCKASNNDALIAKEYNVILSEVESLKADYPKVKMGFDLADFSVYSEKSHSSIIAYIASVSELLNKQYAYLDQKKEKNVKALEVYFQREGVTLEELKNAHYNETMEEIVRNINTKNRIVNDGERLIQKIDPIYNVNNDSFRTHFYAPQKVLFGNVFDTFTVNLMIIWCMSIVLYLTLYFDVFRNFISYLGQLKK